MSLSVFVYVCVCVYVLTLNALQMAGMAHNKYDAIFDKTPEVGCNWLRCSVAVVPLAVGLGRGDSGRSSAEL